MIDTLNLFATSPKGLEGLLFEEIKALTGSATKETPGGVHFQTSLAAAYRVILWSRLANHVLLPLAQFPAPDANALYQGALGIEWAAHFGIEQSFAVFFSSRKSALQHSQFGAQKVKDAIVDQFRERCGERPSVSRSQTQIHINVFIDRDQATVSLNLSGASLHRRGYREQGAASPLMENLAVGILLRAGWPQIARDGGCLLDPCCGSGTLLIEAALLAADIAPGLLRQDFGFLHWRQHDTHAWSQLLAEAHSRREQGLLRLTRLNGSDNNRKAVAIARENVERVGLSEYIEIQHQDLSAARAPQNCSTGLVIVNPPFAEHLALPELYEKLGETLKSHFDGWQAAVLTADPALGKYLGLGARRRYPFFNGTASNTLLCFTLNQDAYRHRPNEPLQPLAAEQCREQGRTSAEMFGNRLRKNFKTMTRWAKSKHIHCYRMYDADLPEYSVAIDIYDGEQRWVHLQEYAAPKTIEAPVAERRFREACAVTLSELGIPAAQLFSKQRSRQRGSAQYEKLDTNGLFQIVEEQGLRFYVNFTDYLDTGLFLDHRPVRAWIRDAAKDKQVLNLFAYTGTASVYAAAGGARQVVSVDMSRTYIEWAKRNFTLNQLPLAAHPFIQADCLEWLRNAEPTRQFDLIFLDPPSFSNSKRMDTTLDIQRDHESLIQLAMSHLHPTGLLLFSTNLRSFKLSDVILAQYHTEDRTAASIPEDFARNPRIHQCWAIRFKTVSVWGKKGQDKLPSETNL